MVLWQSASGDQRRVRFGHERAETVAFVGVCLDGPLERGHVATKVAYIVAQSAYQLLVDGHVVLDEDLLDHFGRLLVHTGA